MNLHNKSWESFLSNFPQIIVLNIDKITNSLQKLLKLGGLIKQLIINSTDVANNNFSY